MKKRGFCLFFVSAASILLSGCTTLHDKLADMSVFKKQLANGDTLNFGTNIVPTASWGCKAVGPVQSYNWAEIKNSAAFTFGNGQTVLMDKAVAYANQQNLKVNYVNLRIPEESTFSVESSVISNEWNLRPDAQAKIFYYQCERINPEHKMSYTKKKGVGMKIGD